MKKKIKINPLETFYEGNVHGAIILDTRREKKTGLYPVRYRVTHLRKQNYFNAGYDLTSEEWEILPTTRKGDLLNTRQEVKKGFSKLKDDVAAILKDDEYTNDKLVTYRKRGRKHGIKAAFDARIKELEDNGQSGTAMIYGCAKNYIDNYDPEAAFSGITAKWLQKFEQSAIKDGLSYSTLGIYLRCLRALFNSAIQERIVKESYYPFARSEGEKRKYRIREGTGTKTALTPGQILTIANYTPQTTAMTRSRDLFLLSFHLGGINFKDLLLLKWEHIVNGEIVYTREKTKTTNRKATTIRIPLTMPAEDIIYKWGNLDHEYILPFMVINPSPADVRRITQNITRKVNLHLDLIGKDISIPGISTMVARHSFATILKNSGVPVAFIAETLGHRSLNTTANYLKGFEKEQRVKHFEALTKIGKS